MSTKRDVTEVIDRILAEVPTVYARLRTNLVCLKESAFFTPPEGQVSIWKRLDVLLITSLSSPPRLPWEVEISRIVTGTDQGEPATAAPEQPPTAEQEPSARPVPPALVVGEPEMELHTCRRGHTWRYPLTSSSMHCEPFQFSWYDGDGVFRSEGTGPLCLRCVRDDLAAKYGPVKTEPVT